MNRPKSRLTNCLALLSLVASSACLADSFASSASSAGSASLGSISDSSKGSSKSSTGGTKVAEGDYKVIEVAVLSGQPGMLQLKLKAAAASGEQGALWLTLPQQALAQRALVAGDLVNASYKPYGIAFAHADSRSAFFLLLADDWRNDLDPQPVAL
ncbi:hypothetical protein BH11PSE10_BH11PSE10_21200 [soil metagenome]